MSAKAMGRVWDLDLPHNKRLVLLAMADHADHEGGSIYPSVALIAWKTGYSDRQVQRIIQELVADGILALVTEHTDHQPNVYQLNLNAGRLKDPYQGRQNVTPPSRQNVTPRGDKMTPTGVTFRPDRGDIAMSPKPWEPPIEPPPPEPIAKSPQPAGGGGGSEPTKTQRALVRFGFSAPMAKRFRNLPLDAVEAELKAAKARGTGPGGLVERWKVDPPGSAPPARAAPSAPIQPTRIERPPDVLTPQEAARALSELRRLQEHAHDA